MLQSIRKKSIVSNGSGKQKMMPSPHKNPKSEKENFRMVSDIELIPLSIPIVIRQQHIHEVTKEDITFLKLPVSSPSKLSLVLEIVDDTPTCNDNVLANNARLHETNIEQSSITNDRSTVGGASIDSPHPIKNCQIHCNKGHEKVMNE